MINTALGIVLIVIGLLVALILFFALISMVDQELDGLITERIKKRFGGDE